MIKLSSRQRMLTVHVFLLALTIFGYFIRQYQFPKLSRENNIFIFFFSFALILMMYHFFSGIDYILDKFYPYEKSVPKRIVIQVFLGVVFILFCRILIYIWIEPIVPFKIDNLFRVTTYVIYVMFSILINLIFFANFFFRQWITSIKKAEILEKEKTQVQFDNLKNQLNPHFLFNALTSLNSLIFDNPQLASDFLQNLSKVYRYVLQNKDKNLVTLGTELNFIENYIFLLKTRFEEAIKINLDICEKDKEKGIVPVTLQILIENATKHNIINTHKPLTIEIKSSGDYLTVWNNHQPKKLMENSNKQGLENMKSLYRFYSKLPIIVEDTTEQYLIKIPLI
jgi:two-component system, LytTR family, sensor kinase